MRLSEILAEAVEFDLSAWGYWITPDGDLIEVNDSHGHAAALYAHQGTDAPLVDGAKWGKAGMVLDTDRYYWDMINARKAGWIWLRITGREVSVAMTSPTRRAKQTLMPILQTLRDSRDLFIADLWHHNVRTRDAREFIRSLQDVPTAG